MLIYYAAISLVTFLVWGYDKAQAQANGWRVAERTLFALVLAGGAFGALVGMQLFRHKTRKLAFQILVPAGCVLHFVVAYIFAG